MPYKDPEQRRAYQREWERQRPPRSRSTPERKRYLSDAYQRDKGFRLMERRERLSIPPERWRGPRQLTPLGEHKHLDARPFAVWLAWWMAHNDIPSVAEAARQLAVNDKTLREALDGKRDTLTVAFVTRALDRTETGLWDLYDPDTLAPLA